METDLLACIRLSTVESTHSVVTVAISLFAYVGQVGEISP